ncbi:uncharacterized protein AMSG_06459 [Thecamonas trahens ATCC 50062]|uniref:RanBP2-type domain-containing protein n=1 Tax=Thecamonas trahens ATCC 50062 TaxID=461836 RepID=A0A0L0DIG8_THETB|nr:hypothetical protein AMSG_06459 [Thecamonas trahens ATCC 50062]KNC51113.1 hypothetical protein AMSG_06459 [Thecamonas trahens ATCC 50062]|eukprot:XP_013756321.1 hypothetical protein AMSG_06459 [Thecamonas trahens ATCC 50062]
MGSTEFMVQMEELSMAAVRMQELMRKSPHAAVEAGVPSSCLPALDATLASVLAVADSTKRLAASQASLSPESHPDPGMTSSLLPSTAAPALLPASTPPPVVGEPSVPPYLPPPESGSVPSSAPPASAPPPAVVASAPPPEFGDGVDEAKVASVMRFAQCSRELAIEALQVMPAVEQATMHAISLRSARAAAAPPPAGPPPARPPPARPPPGGRPAGPPPGPPPTATPPPPTAWSCASCTYENDVSAPTCGMCTAPRP